MIEESLKKVVAGQDLSENESYECMVEMMGGTASDIHMSAFLTALVIKGETVPEITGFARAMKNVCVNVSTKLKVPLVDTVGTGGDRLKTFNVSSTASIIAASCGVVIAKHGNRSITSICGAADILEALGVNINCDAQGVENCLEKAGIGFMFAQNFHPAMKNVMPVRRQLGIRTAFNILGPLTSPANADIQLLGVFDPDYIELIVEVLKNLGVQRAMVVHGFDGSDEPAMDEISTIGKTRVAVLENGKVRIQELYPEDFGLKKSDSRYIKAPATLEENVDVVMGVLKGRRNSAEDEARLNLCLANAGATLYIAGKVKDLKSGVEMASQSIESGRALQKLEEFVKVSNMCKNSSKTSSSAPAK